MLKYENKQSYACVCSLNVSVDYIAVSISLLYIFARPNHENNTGRSDSFPICLWPTITFIHVIVKYNHIIVICEYVCLLTECLIENVYNMVCKSVSKLRMAPWKILQAYLNRENRTVATYGPGKFIYALSNWTQIGCVI